jgi:hypothetical protein
MTTWKPIEKHGDLSGTAAREKLPDYAFAFPDKRKEPITDASHVRTALARFDQVHDVTDNERDQAVRNILAAAKHFGVQVEETDWRQLGNRPHTPNPAHLVAGS